MPNGLTAILQPMKNAESTAITVVTPCGAIYDPSDNEGLANIASEWIMRGAGDRDSKQLDTALDILGAQHSIATGHRFMLWSSLQLSRNLPDIITIAADIFQKPMLEDTHFEQCRDLCRQDIEALEDEPARMATLLLRENFFPYPLNRSVMGTLKSINMINLEDAREHIRKNMVPENAIIAIAGKIDCDKTIDHINELFGDWQGNKAKFPAIIPPNNGVHHYQKDSAQQHIAIGHKAPLLSNTRMYYPARIFEAILSHGMGSRLFAEVREKRGLVYHVSSSYSGSPEAAGMITTAGSRPEVVDETLSVITEVLSTSGEDITDDELLRAKIQIRSSLVMHGQSPASRTSAIVSDWFQLGHIRQLHEIESTINNVTKEDIINYLADFPLCDPTISSVGPNSLSIQPSIQNSKDN